MSTQQFIRYSVGRASLVLLLARLFLWSVMGFWAFLFVWTLWRWALGLV